MVAGNQFAQNTVKHDIFNVSSFHSPRIQPLKQSSLKFKFTCFQFESSDVKLKKFFVLEPLLVLYTTS